MFNTKQEYTTYTVMISRVANGFILQLLDSDGEIVRTAIAIEDGIRDYSSNSLCSAIEELWGYAEKLVKDEAALTAVAEARESEL